MRRLAWLAIAFVVLTAALVAVAGQPVPVVHAGSSLAVGVPTLVDPIRGAGEPYIAIGRDNDAWITGPGGSSAQTSFFFHSLDGNLTYRHISPTSDGHLVCPLGGGDSQILIDRNGAQDTIYLTDQEALANFGTGKIQGATVTTGCATAPAMTADRPFQGLLDPQGTTKAPQFVANGNNPMVYLSWLCSACGTGGGLAFAWTDDGVTYHPADPGVIDTGPLNLLSGTILGEGSTFPNFSGHGTTFVDQESGYVFTGLSCSGSCPNGESSNQLGVTVGKPPAVIGTNKGQFGTLTYQKAVDHFAGGMPFPEGSSLFPVIGMDPAGTLYLVWTQGDGSSNTDAELDPTSWHVYYSYSKDLPDHTVWSDPIQVDTGPDTVVSNMAWVATGDPGKLAFTWLGTDKREHPSKANEDKHWHPFLAVTTNGDTPNPTFQTARIGENPNHLSDMCLSGTVGCITAVGNRNMADFISVEVAPDGAAQVTWASDANRLATSPLTLIPGLPLNMTARQTSGPKLIGSGDVSDSRFSTTPTHNIGDAAGDGSDPRTLPTVTNVPQMDLMGSSIGTDGTDLLVYMPTASLGDTTSPDALHPNTWWFTTWQYKTKLYFAKVEVDSGGTPKFTAGIPASYDRPALNAQTAATLVDYRGGTQVSGEKQGNEWIIHVPTGLVGNPTTGESLEAVQAWTAIDNGAPPFVTAAIGNIPTVFDATGAYNAALGDLPPAPVVMPPDSGSPENLPNTAEGAPGPWILAMVSVVLLVALGVSGFRRRGRRGRVTLG
jgi:hypothetical protein